MKRRFSAISSDSANASAGHPFFWRSDKSSAAACNKGALPPELQSSRLWSSHFGSRNKTMDRAVPEIVLSPHFEQKTETVVRERHGGEWQPKFLHILTVAFGATFLTANILAFKVAEISGVQFGAAAALFPFSLLVGDTLSEVYGFKRTRNAVFVSLASYGFFVGMAHLTIALPAAAEWKFQSEYEMFYTTTLRVFIGASSAFLVSQILNAYVIVKIKAITHGRHFYVRALAATIVSESAHTLVVAPIMFASILTFDKLVHLVFVSTGVKVFVELAALPFTYILILKLKKAEGVDFYDT